MVLRSALFLIPLAVASGGVGQHVWELDLNAGVKEAVPASHFVAAVAFSEDDNWIAVLLSHGARLLSGDSYLLIIDVQHPEQNIRLADVPGSCWSGLTWNSEDDAVLACGRVIQIRDRTSCAVAGKSKTFWLDGRHVVSEDGKIFDRACTETGNFPLAGGWRIGAAAALTGWVLLERLVWSTAAKDVTFWNNTEITLVDRSSGQPVSGWEKGVGGISFDGATFAVGAQAVFYLQATPYFDIDRERVYISRHCRRVNGGREIGIPMILKGDLSKITQSATSSPRALVEKWGYGHMFLDDLFPPVLKKQMIIDLLSGRIILSWKPREQTPSALHHYTLSSTGRYLAESGDGRLELDRLPP